MKNPDKTPDSFKIENVRGRIVYAGSMFIKTLGTLFEKRENVLVK